MISKDGYNNGDKMIEINWIIDRHIGFIITLKIKVKQIRRGGERIQGIEMTWIIEC